LYRIGTTESLYSPEVTFFCAGLPDPPSIPNLIWKDSSRMNINWFSGENSGSSILGFIVYMKLSTNDIYSIVYDGSTDPNTNYLTITSLNNHQLQVNVSYQISIRAKNIVGLGGYSPILEVILGNFPSSSNSVITGLSDLYSGYSTIVKIQVRKKYFSD
jgi:hypothetical protein